MSRKTKGAAAVARKGTPLAYALLMRLLILAHIAAVASLSRAYGKPWAATAIAAALGIPAAMLIARSFLNGGQPCEGRGACAALIGGACSLIGPAGIFLFRPEAEEIARLSALGGSLAWWLKSRDAVYAAASACALAPGWLALAASPGTPAEKAVNFLRRNNIAYTVLNMLALAVMMGAVFVCACGEGAWYDLGSRDAADQIMGPTIALALTAMGLASMAVLFRSDADMEAIREAEEEEGY